MLEPSLSGSKREWVNLKVVEERVCRLPEPVYRIGHRPGSRDGADTDGEAPEQCKVQGAATCVHGMPVFMHSRIPDMEQTFNRPVTPDHAAELLLGGVEQIRNIRHHFFRLLARPLVLPAPDDNGD